MGMRMRYPNPSETGIRFNFLAPLSMGRVTDKYMRIGDGDGEGKIRPLPAPLSYLNMNNSEYYKKEFILFLFTKII